MREVFKQAGRRDPDASVNALIDRIIDARPDLADATFYVPSQGKNSLTVMTAEEVFKAPKRGEDKPYFVQEFRFLEHMNGYEWLRSRPCHSARLASR